MSTLKLASLQNIERMENMEKAVLQILCLEIDNRQYFIAPNKRRKKEMRRSKVKQSLAKSEDSAQKPR